MNFFIIAAAPIFLAGGVTFIWHYATDAKSPASVASRKALSLATALMLIALVLVVVGTEI